MLAEDDPSSIPAAVASAERAGDVAGAVRALVNAIERHSSVAAWHYLLGTLRERQSDWTGAAEAYSHAARLDPVRATAHARLGRARERVWDFEGAVDAYAAVLETYPHRGWWRRKLERARREALAFKPYAGRIIAHRGRCGGLPENSVESLAALPSWVAGVEVDVRLSRDGVPVLMHDADLHRTTGVRGEVGAWTMGQLRGMSDGEGKAIYILDDYLCAFNQTGLELILVDIKSPTARALSVVVSVVRASSVADKCVLMLRDPAVLKALREFDRELRAGLFRVNRMNWESKVAAALLHGAEMLLVRHGDTGYLRNRSVIPRIQKAGLLAGASTVNAWCSLDAARADSCDLLLTDSAEQLRFFGAPTHKSGKEV